MTPYRPGLGDHLPGPDTRQRAEQFVRDALGPEYAADFDVAAIADRLYDLAGSWDVGSVPTFDFWETCKAHDRSQDAGEQDDSAGQEVSAPRDGDGNNEFILPFIAAESAPRDGDGNTARGNSEQGWRSAPHDGDGNVGTGFPPATICFAPHDGDAAGLTSGCKSFAPSLVTPGGTFVPPAAPRDGDANLPKSGNRSRTPSAPRDGDGQDDALPELTAESSVAEVRWVAKEARALMSVDDPERRARFLARKRALLAYIERTTG